MIEIYLIISQYYSAIPKLWDLGDQCASLFSDVLTDVFFFCFLGQRQDGVLSYILAPLTLRPGDQVVASEAANIVPGNCLPLRSGLEVGAVRYG